MPIVRRKCSRCGVVKLREEFARYNNRGRKGFLSMCKSCKSESASLYSGKYLRRKKSNPIQRMLMHSKLNSYRRKLEFTITEEDIPAPKRCIYLDCVLDYRSVEEKGEDIRESNMATLDRIDSTKGYVPGNVQVISFLANRLKSNATVKELLQFARGILTVHG